jgi:anti-anti-sigma regulatory factor
MSFHFVSHSWEVKNLDDGLTVTVGQHELDPSASADLVDELFELVRESGQSNLYVDLGNVSQLANIDIGKLNALDALLRTIDCRLILCNVAPAVHQAIRDTRLTDNLDARPG